MIGVVFTSRNWSDLRSHDLYLPSPHLHAALVLLLSPSSSPPPILFSFCSPWGLLLFPPTARRYRKDQITMATISHIVIAHTLVWWLFLFWRVGGCCPYLIGGAPSNLFWCWRNNVAICWIHVCTQWSTVKNIQHPLRWLITVSHMAKRTGWTVCLSRNPQVWNAYMFTEGLLWKGQRSPPGFRWMQQEWKCGINTDIYRYVQTYADRQTHTHTHTSIHNMSTVLLGLKTRTCSSSSAPTILCIGKWWNVFTPREIETNVRDNISPKILAECYPWKSWNSCCCLGVN